VKLKKVGTSQFIHGSEGVLLPKLKILKVREYPSTSLRIKNSLTTQQKLKKKGESPTRPDERHLNEKKVYRTFWMNLVIV
jgi:hypothetical protein